MAYPPPSPTRGPNPAQAPEAPTAPEPEVAPSPVAVRPMDYLASPRYAYLSGRLRSRQITMEEATELFAIFQSAIASLPPSPVPRGGMAGPGAPERPRRPRAAARREGGPVALSDEDLGLALVAFGAGAGLLAAILKRSAEGPKAASPK